MQSNQPHKPNHKSYRRQAAGFLFGAAAVLTSVLAMPQTSFAAEFSLSGSGTFRPPSKDQVANLPAELPFSRADLVSGRWSFSARYDDAAADADPDPYVGRFAGAIRSFRLVIGATTIDLPVDKAEIVISDGGSGFPGRESVRLQGQAMTSAGLLRLGWIQVNQQPNGTELRGPAGSLSSDRLPSAALMANLPVASAFDRFVELRIEPPGGGRPLLYLSSSKLSVTAVPASQP